MFPQASKLWPGRGVRRRAQRGEAAKGVAKAAAAMLLGAAAWMVLLFDPCRITGRVKQLLEIQSNGLATKKEVAAATRNPYLPARGEAPGGDYAGPPIHAHSTPS